MATDEERTPRWTLLLAGLVLISALRPRSAPAPVQAAAPPTLAAGTVRELRRVPGLGDRRALALVDARWSRARGDPPLYLGDVAGVGPVSEAQVALWLAAAGAASALR
jgi:hypothetical protein